MSRFRAKSMNELTRSLLSLTEPKETVSADYLREGIRGLRSAIKYGECAPQTVDLIRKAFGDVGYSKATAVDELAYFGLWLGDDRAEGYVGATEAGPYNEMVTRLVELIKRVCQQTADWRLTDAQQYADKAFWIGPWPLS